MQKSLFQFASYGLGGGLAFVLTTLSLTLLTETAHWHHLPAAVAGYGLGFLVNFAFQLLVTFHAGTNRFAARLFRFALIQMLGFVLFIGLIALLADLVGFHYLVAYLVAVIITCLFNFILSKRFAFAQLSTPASVDQPSA